MNDRTRKVMQILSLAMTIVIPGGSVNAADCAAPAAPGVDWQRCYHDSKNMSKVDLTRARLQETSFQRGILDGADLQKADGFRIRLISASLRNTRLDNGIFTEGDFTKANAEGASFRDADLRRSRFFRAVLRGADFTGARLQGADFLHADLSGARWTDGEKICAEGSVGGCN